jgi:hypothetical protein
MIVTCKYQFNSSFLACTSDSEVLLDLVNATSTESTSYFRLFHLVSSKDHVIPNHSRVHERLSSNESRLNE